MYLNKYFLQLLLSAFTSAIQMKAMNQMKSYGYIVDIIIHTKNASDAIIQLQLSSDLKYADDLSQALANLQEIQHDFFYFDTQPKDNLNSYHELLEDTESILNKIKTQLNCTEIESIKLINHFDGILKTIQHCLIEISNYQNEVFNIEDDLELEDCQEAKEKIFNNLVDLLIEAKNVLTEAQVELINEIKNSNDDMKDEMFDLAARLKVAKNYLSKIQFEITKNGKC